jgi:hypothetical protein
MQLVLAIDSDPRRSEQLASLVRARLTVDLVQATSAGEGLHALQDRIPDLILTSPLLSPFDDGVLDEYLRDLGAAGAHVQAVRIPVLSAGPMKRALAKRLFSLGRTKATSAATPDGCDPKVFADEIAVYLSRAAGARQSVAAVVEALSPRQEAPLTPVAPSPVVIDSRVSSEAFIDDFTDAMELADTAVADKPYTEGSEPLYVEAPEPSYIETPEPSYIEAAELRYIEDPEPPYVGGGEPAHELSTEPAPLEAFGSTQFDEAPNTGTAIVDTTRDAEQVTTPGPNRKARDTSATFEAALAAIRAAWVKPDAPEIAESSSAAAAPRSAAQGEVDLTGAIDGLEDGARDRHDPKADALSPTDNAATPRAQSEVDGANTRPENGLGQVEASDRPPIQDEWGVFDPDQCGFSALVDRIDEVAESKKAPHRKGVTSRVISTR